MLKYINFTIFGLIPPILLILALIALITFFLNGRKWLYLGGSVLLVGIIMMGLRDLVDPWIAREMAQPFWQMILGVIFASMTIGALTLYYLTKIWPLLIYGASLGFISVIYLAVSAPIAIPAL